MTQTVAACLVLATALSTGGVVTSPVAAAAGAQSKWAEYLPNVEVVTQEGKALRFYDDVVKGNIVVFSFIYTSCLSICPLITARLALVYEALGEAAGRDIRFVSISIDPERDTPERLKRHAEAFRSDPRWLFLTGTSENINLIRYKLGERSRKITEHGSHIMLFNDRTGEWLRDSAFADAGILAVTMRRMDKTYELASAKQNDATRSRRAPTDPPGQALFVKACASCHTVGRGDRVGPDLAGVADRRERQWLKDFIRTPQAFHAANDPVAVALAERFPKVRMPNLQISDADVNDLLAYLEARQYAAASKDMAGPHSNTSGIPASLFNEKPKGQGARKSTGTRQTGGHAHH